jgi:hypothetical protein
MRGYPNDCSPNVVHLTSKIQSLVTDRRSEMGRNTRWGVLIPSAA